ncbi:MAG TPA: hypothetical protein VGL58_05630 [Caulobacteraceae bacterium]|jgi:hypothetical protein
MTPSVRDILTCAIRVLSTPPNSDAGPEYAASRAGITAALVGMAAGEGEVAAGAAIAENAAIRALFAEALQYNVALDTHLDHELAPAAEGFDADLAVPALDADNAALRRLLIRLHEAVEKAGDHALEHKILALYVKMAEGRRL